MQSTEPQTPPALDPKSAPALDRYCDLVLTGGVTSGVLYPWAILELARTYRFKNIGGTSVGAMAAALAAAAEFVRAHGSPGGFEVLRQLPGALAADEGGTTKLLSLFQPVAGTKRLFSVFLYMLNRSEHSNRFAWAARLLLAITWFYKVGLIAGLVAAALLLLAFAWTVGSPGVLGATLTSLLLAALFGAVAIYWDIVRGLPANGFGLCKGGRSKDPSAPPALTQWLHEGIQQAAGRAAKTEAVTFGEPLTFKDLAGAGGDSSINLQMITTNLSHGRPYTLPLRDLSARLFFKIDELRSYFPDSVLNHLSHAPRYAPRTPDEPAATTLTADLLELPGNDLPIVVAARLSLSFPFLFSAVPLWAIDYEAEVGQRTLQKCWFSDGGICSNFPIHFFDALIPRWPTFGISLGPRSRHWPNEPVWLPRFHNQGRGDAWNRFGEATSPAASLGGFVAALVDSAKNWNDNTLMRMPGVRDRIVRVGLKADEGNLNLKLSGRQIMQIANTYGTLAGVLLRKKFAGETQSDKPSAAWDEHRWVRFNVLVSTIAECFKRLESSAESSPHAAKISDLIRRAFLEHPLAGERPAEYALSAAQSDAMEKLHAALLACAATFEEVQVNQPFLAEPEPALRIRPRV